MVHRQSITGCAAAAAQRGLTLIELLVVMGILALAATIVIVNAPPIRSEAREASADLASVLRAAADDAVVGGGVFRLEITKARWRLMNLIDGEWVAIEESAHNPNLSLAVEITDPAESNLFALTGEREERPERDAPKVLRIDPFGDGAAFSIDIVSRNERWRVRHDHTGAVAVERG